MNVKLIKRKEKKFRTETKNGRKKSDKNETTN